MRPLLGLLRKECYHILRDKRTLVVLLALPVVQVVLFGYAIRTDVNDVRLAIVDPAPDEATRALRERFGSSDIFRTVAVVSRMSDLDSLFEAGAVQQAVAFEAGFGSHLGTGTPARVLIVSDATEPNTGSLLQAYAQAVIEQYQRDLAPATPAAVQRGTHGGVRRAMTIVPVTRMRFNPTRESSNLFVPGLMAFVLTIISSLMTAISLTREKETGTMEALLVSPLRPWAIIVGKVAPYLVVGFMSVVAVLIEATVVFHVPLHGSVTLLLFEGGLYILVSLALGILVSARTSSQRVAMMVALVGTMLPNVLLSGFIFPIESMPVLLQIVSYAVPGRWFVSIARGIMLKGIGLEYLWRETLTLAAMSVLLLVASARSFKERLA